MSDRINNLDELRTWRHAVARSLEPSPPPPRLEIAGLTEGQRLAIEQAVRRHLGTCGCKGGALAMLITLVGLLAKHEISGTELGLASAAGMFASVVLAGAFGKLAHMFHARLRFSSIVRSVELSLRQYPHGEHEQWAGSAEKGMGRGAS